jgi:hypothetical protein
VEGPKAVSAGLAWYHQWMKGKEYREEEKNVGSSSLQRKSGPSFVTRILIVTTEY